MTFTAFAVDRLRMSTDGTGVTTLVCGYGCPLDCRWCINPQCKPKERARFPKFSPKTYTVEELYDAVKVDSLYFEATGGGITFGGGEPLLQADFIREFIEYTRSMGKQWRFAAETCLNVPEDALETVKDLLDEFIVDVKDMDPAVYEAYTGVKQERMRKNLETLARLCPDKVTARIPLIPEYNTEADTARSQEALEAMGLTRFDRFGYVIRETMTE